MNRLTTQDILRRITHGAQDIALQYVTNGQLNPYSQLDVTDGGEPNRNIKNIQHANLTIATFDTQNPQQTELNWTELTQLSHIQLLEIVNILITEAPLLQ